MAQPVRLTLLLAVVFSLALLAFGLFYPAYSRVVQTPGSETVTGSATIVEVNGPAVLVTLSVPLVVTALVAWCLMRSGQAARIVAWVLVLLLFAFAVLGLASIGLLILPIAVTLAVATGWPRPDEAGSPDVPDQA